MLNKIIQIADRKIGVDYKPLVIAEIGINHNGSLDEAKKIVDAAHQAGVEVVKHQTHIPEAEMSNIAKRVIPGNSKQSIWDIIQRCTLSEEDEIELQKYVHKKGMIFISTPFSYEAVDRLERMKVPAYKIGSGEMNNPLFVEYVATKKKPIILSTGMNDILAVKKAISVIKKYHSDIAILHTTNLYPTPSSLIRLGALEEIKNTFPGEVIGLSDHSLNNLACLAATALGGSILERHFTDTKDRIGEDIICSMDAKECSELIRDAAEIAKMRGGNKAPSKEESVTMNFAFSTLISACDIPENTKIERSMITTKRPGSHGILATNFEDVLGKKTKRIIKRGEHIEWSDIIT